jgi:hypothetical protein
VNQTGGWSVIKNTGHYLGSTMSHWDFGRPMGGEHDAPRPSGAAGAAYPPDQPGGARDGAWPAGYPWLAEGERPTRAEWAAGDGRDDDGWDDDEGMTPYPLTYERDDFVAADQEPAPAADAWQPWPPAPYAAGLDADTTVLTGDDTGERAPRTRPRGTAGRGIADAAAATGWTGRDLGLPGDDPADWAAGSTRRGGRRLLALAGVVVAGAGVGAAAVLLTSGHPSAGSDQGSAGSVARSATPSTPAGKGSAGTGPAGTGPSPSATGPLTMAQAKGVVAAYTTVNNDANAQRSDTMLASVESGSSYAIDAGLYQEQQAAGTAPFPAFDPVQATYYIPRDEPAGGPRWFVAQVANAFDSNQRKVTSSEYLLFTQSALGGAWQDTIEPYLLAGVSAPRIAVGADGLATATGPDAASVAVAPSQLPAATAASLDGTGTGTGTGTGAVADPGNLADLADQKFWQGKIPGGTVTDTHTAAAGADGQEFALLTGDGGALVFYTDAAQLTITPPAGSTLRLTIPGFYSSSQALSQAGVSYLEQFAAYDPPAGDGAPRVVADYSGITGND